SDLIYFCTFWNFEVLLTKAYERPPSSIFNTCIWVFFKYTNDFVFIFLTFLFNDLNSLTLRDIKRINSFWHVIKCLVVTDLWTKSSDSHCRLFIFVFAYFFGKLEQIHSIFEGNGFDQLPFSQ